MTPAPAPKPEPKPLLDLDTIVEAPCIRVNGTDYPLLHPESFGLLEYRRIAKLAVRIHGLAVELDNDTISDEGYAALAEGLDELVRFVMPAPDEVHRSLNEMHRMGIANCFTKLFRESERTALERAKRVGVVLPSTGGSTSRV